MSEPYEKIGTNDNSSFFGVFPPPFVDDRSSKKASWRANGMDANNPLPASYRDALRDSGLRKNSIHGMTEGEEFHDDDWDFEPGDVMVSSDGAMPTIDFSERIQEKLIKPWQNSIVVKLLGKNIGYRVLYTRLKSRWKRNRELSVVDLENNFFLIRLQSYEDVEYALTEGPWVIMGHYLTVQPWSPQFDSKVNKLDTVNAWIRLPGMPMHLYDKRILKKVDNHGLHRLCMAWQRGFRRIMVEVDSKAITQILENSTTPVNEHHSLILAIRELLSRDWVVKVNHIYREANIVTDFLASFSLSFPLGLQLLTVAPPNLQRILNNDMSGIAHSRLVVL
ncbi:hypothetical protein AB3S75_037595 [Citrus x aurantiifolia]